MKKILLLGGSAQQIVAIEIAKRLSYYTILCDYLADNPGQYVADTFYLVSTTDKEAVLEVAKKEHIDGVLAYASDPAAPTAAYVAEQLGLPGNPYESVEILCNKDKFRAFLAANGFCTPKAKGYADIEEAIADIKSGNYAMPVIVKPVDSSGSKGSTVLQTLENIEKAIEFAFSFSRGRRVIVEEFIEMNHPYLIGGDVFVVDRKIKLWGLLNCHRDFSTNPLVPAGKSYPLELEPKDVDEVKLVLQKLVEKLGILDGALNVELVIDKNGKVYPIDIGPRNGGNMIPDLLEYIFDVNVVEMSVKVAMGEKITANRMGEGIPYYATYNLHVPTNGFLKSINFSQEIEKYIVRKCIHKQPGEEIQYFDNASKALGIIFMKFDDKETMDRILGNMCDHVGVELTSKMSE